MSEKHSNEEFIISLKDRINTNLDEYKQLSQQIIKALSEGNATNATELMKKIIDKDKELSILKDELKENQLFQQKINNITREIEEKDRAITEVMSNLRKAEGIIGTAVEEGKRKLKIMEQAEKASPDVPTLIAYSHRISATTSAPPNWNNTIPLLMFRPPAPREDEMRSGLLYTKLGKDL